MIRPRRARRRSDFDRRGVTVLTTALTAALAAANAACGDTGAEFGGAPEIRLEVEQPSRTVGQPHEFRVNASGRWLVAVLFDYGDGHADTIPAHGAQSISHEQSHTYAAPGTYRVLAATEDALAGAVRDSVAVTVTAAAGQSHPTVVQSYQQD